jgi:hypothetical protein
LFGSEAVLDNAWQGFESVYQLPNVALTLQELNCFLELFKVRVSELTFCL